MEPGSLSQTTSQSAKKFGRALPIHLGCALAVGALLRIWMLRHFFEVNGDAEVYGGLAKALLQHGRYALEVGDGIWQPTLIRLPGYPLYLAACFKFFGMENYYAPCLIQIVLDLVGCVLLALFAARIAGAPRARRAGLVTLWLAACCPFTAIFAAFPLTEALTLFTISVALWSMGRFCATHTWGSALGFTLAITFAALLRPDGALLGVALAPVMVISLARGRESFQQKLALALACLLLACTPFAAWTIRNWRALHVFQPLAPRYANDPGEFTTPGFQKWTKTWCLDFVSTFEIYWNVPKGPIDIDKLPSRAFDSAAQYSETKRILAAYEANDEVIDRRIDAQFEQLAEQRIQAHPFRSHVLLPLGRMLDMWFRPRIENLPIDLDWWRYDRHEQETRFSYFYLLLNLAFVLMALEGLRRRPHFWGAMLSYFVLRSALLCTIEAPEARYTIECFPMILLLAGLVIAGWQRDARGAVR